MANVGEQLTSIVWGNKPVGVSQGFGTYNPETAWMYKYAESYGWPAGTHIGLDVAVPFGTDIYAAQSGRVTQSGFSDSFRPYPIWIEETDGDIAIYGHLSENFVSTGDTVKAGQLIGKSGEQTKQGTTIPDGSGPHIHFELRRDGKAIDPDSELRGTGELSGKSGSFSALDIVGGVPGKILVVGAGIGVLLFGLAMFK